MYLSTGSMHFYKKLQSYFLCLKLCKAHPPSYQSSNNGAEAQVSSLLAKNPQDNGYRYKQMHFGENKYLTSFSSLKLAHLDPFE